MNYLSITAVPLVNEEVINSVITNSRVLFRKEGCGEDALNKLKETWERKLSERDAIPKIPPMVSSSVPPIRDKSQRKSLYIQRNGSAQIRKTKQRNQKLLAKPITTPLSTPLCEAIKTSKSECLSMPLLDFEDEDAETPPVKPNGTTDLIPQVKKEEELNGITINKKKINSVPQPNTSTSEEVLLLSKMCAKKTAYVKLIRMADLIPKAEKENESSEAFSCVSKKQTKQGSLQLALQPGMSSMQQVLPKYKDTFEKKPVVGIVTFDDKNAKMHKTIETNNNDVIVTVKKNSRGRPRKEASVVIEPVIKRKRGRPRKETSALTAVIKEEEGLTRFIQELKITGKQEAILQTYQSKSETPQGIKPLLDQTVKEFKKNKQDQTSTTMQDDGSSFYPKFNIKAKPTGIPVKVNKLKLGNSEIDSTDDFTDDEASQRPFECNNIIICQYEKVKRTKNKWKINLKNGIMHLDGKDYVFKTATAKGILW